MPDSRSSGDSSGMLEKSRPWAFTSSELTASLRRHTGDPNLIISEISPRDFLNRRPSIGRIRGLHVVARGSLGDHRFDLVVKEPQGSTRTGTAGGGLREISIYKILGDQMPVRIPQMVASHPGGGWLVMHRLIEERTPENWLAADYLLAIDQLAALHDRFWALGEDLANYPWISRPFDADFSIHVRAAASSIQRLAVISPPTLLSKDPSLLSLLQRILENIDAVRQALSRDPFTLLHGDYWPGNINIHPDGSLTVFDWERAAVGPAVVDLVAFIFKSRWWFDDLPVSQEDLIARYRQSLAASHDFAWNDADWQAASDYALLWIFVADWVDLLASIPNSVLKERSRQLDQVWLHPVRQAADRRLPRS